MEVNLDVTITYNYLAENFDKYGIFIFEGSTRSGKTIAIIQYMINYAIHHPNTYIRCCRFNEADHTNSTILDMDFCLGPAMFNLSSDDNYYVKKTVKPKEYTFFNGSKIVFSATNDIGKLHGMAQDILWLNEVMHIPYTAYKQLTRRTKKKIIMDFNPSYNRHWVFEKIMKKGDYGYQHTTYKDNRFLTELQIKEIEDTNPDIPANVMAGTADAYEWAVYGLGQRGNVKGAIFKLWDTTDFWPEHPQSCMRWGFGLDFGFSVDPTALVECCIHNRGLYLREHLYDTQVYTTKNITMPSLPSIQGKFEEMNMPKDVMIVADCAASENIASLNNLGYNIASVKKGPGSILDGITQMKRFKIYVHRDSPNLQLEFEHYKWKIQTWKDGEDTERKEPVDKYNHLIDAARYWVMMNKVGNESFQNRGRGSGRPEVISRVRQRQRR